MKSFLAIFLITLGLNSCKFKIAYQTDDKINNQSAIQLYDRAIKEQFRGGEGFKKAISLLNKADSFEPNNAIIIHERGLAKIHSKIDIKGGLADINKSINCSKDFDDKLIRYNSLGLVYMDLGNMDKACENWRKAGIKGVNYKRKYCKKHI